MGTKTKKATAKDEHPKLSPVSAFVGRLLYKTTGAVKMCEWCGAAEAMWQHQTQSGKQVLLCFGCGGH